MTRKRRNTGGIFAEFDAQFTARNYATVPNRPGTKKPACKDWTKRVLSAEERAERRTRFANGNIGLLAGTTISSTRHFGFVDVDNDNLTRFVQTLIRPFISGKVGQKGLTVFCQFDRGIKSTKLRRKGSTFPAVEVFSETGQTVTPPSKHPSGVRYRWVGKSLVEIESSELPVFTAETCDILRTVICNEHTWNIVEGGATAKCHDEMLSLTSSGIAMMTEDLPWLAECLNSLLHKDHSGNTAQETLGMLASARAKGLGKANNQVTQYDPGLDGPVALGFTKDGLFAFRDQIRNLIILASATQLLSSQYLMGLASSAFWSKQFPSEKGIFNSYRAGEALLSNCKTAGPFVPSRVRGRGIWREGERLIVNLGGEAPSSTKFLYPCFEPIRFQETNSYDTKRLLNFLNSFRWRNPQDAMLLLGWLAIAPICGVLNWRPHCFLYGPPRCGKTTLHALAAVLLHPLVVSTDGQSSEAGIRQTLGPDSLAVIIDEFESDHSGAGLRGILRLARSASSADNPVLRGTPEGKAMQFSLRTTFFFCAVNPGRMSPADQTRMLMLELLPHMNDSSVAKRLIEEESHFRSLEGQWCGYMVSLASLVEPAFDLFGPLIPSADRRHRQNFATLLAGAFAALHGRLPSPEEARLWAAEYTPSVDRHAEEIERDNSRERLDHLLGFEVEHFPLGHWIAVSLEDTGKGAQHFAALRIMALYDIVTRDAVRDKQNDPAGVFFRNGSPAIDKIFQNTPWEGRGWERALRGLEDAFSVKNPIYFSGTRKKSRCIGIPIDYIPPPIETGSSPDVDDC